MSCFIVSIAIIIIILYLFYNYAIDRRAILIVSGITAGAILWQLFGDPQHNESSRRLRVIDGRAEESELAAFLKAQENNLLNTAFLSADSLILKKLPFVKSMIRGGKFIVFNGVQSTAIDFAHESDYEALAFAPDIIDDMTSQTHEGLFTADNIAMRAGERTMIGNPAEPAKLRIKYSPGIMTNCANILLAQKIAAYYSLHSQDAIASHSQDAIASHSQSTIASTSIKERSLTASSNVKSHSSFDAEKIAQITPLRHYRKLAIDIAAECAAANNVRINDLLAPSGPAVKSSAHKLLGKLSAHAATEQLDAIATVYSGFAKELPKLISHSAIAKIIETFAPHSQEGANVSKVIHECCLGAPFSSLLGAFVDTGMRNINWSLGTLFDTYDRCLGATSFIVPGAKLYATDIRADIIIVNDISALAHMDQIIIYSFAYKYAIANNSLLIAVDPEITAINAILRGSRNFLGHKLGLFFVGSKDYKKQIESFAF